MYDTKYGQNQNPFLPSRKEAATGFLDSFADDLVGAKYEDDWQSLIDRQTAAGHGDLERYRGDHWRRGEIAAEIQGALRTIDQSPQVLETGMRDETGVFAAARKAAEAAAQPASTVGTGFWTTPDPRVGSFVQAHTEQQVQEIPYPTPKPTPPAATTPAPRSRSKPLRTPESEPPFPMSNPVEGFPRLRRDDPNQFRGHPWFGAPRTRVYPTDDYGRIRVVRREHKGLDIAAAPGSTIRSTVSGVVLNIGDPYGTGKYKIVWVRQDDGKKVGHFYVTPHDAKGRVLVKPGDQVTAGTIIGTMQDRAADDPGMENHLHLETIVDGQAVDPGPSLEQWQREIMRERGTYGK
jgi:murein DD-endopeptidase MepM/ murein hydrolase activator NlpD